MGLINDFFPLVKKKGKHFCYRCKVKYISLHHKNFYENHFCTANPNGSPYLSFENLPGEIYMIILTYLPFADSINLIYTLRDIVTSHGFERIWKQYSMKWCTRLRPFPFRLGCSKLLLRRMTIIGKIIDEME